MSWALQVGKPKNKNRVNTGPSRLTIPIPEYGLSEDVLCDDPCLRIRLSKDSLEVSLMRSILVRDGRNFDSPSDSYIARKIPLPTRRISTHLR